MEGLAQSNSSHPVCTGVGFTLRDRLVINTGNTGDRLLQDGPVMPTPTPKG